MVFNGRNILHRILPHVTKQKNSVEVIHIKEKIRNKFSKKNFWSVFLFRLISSINVRSREILSKEETLYIEFYHMSPNTRGIWKQYISKESCRQTAKK